MPAKGVLLSGEILWALRQELGQSSADVARALELHPNYYNRVEAGAARVSLKVLHRIETYFGIDPASLDLVHPVERARFVTPS